MRRAAALLVLGLVAAQAALGLASIVSDATSSSLANRRRALLAPELERVDQSLGAQATLYRELVATLAPLEGLPAVVYLFPSEGLPTDLDQLAVLQQRFGTPLAALLQPAVVRLLGPELNPGPLIGDETLFVVEIGPHKERPFMALLEELARGENFRIFQLPHGASL